jgi:hypothetical protein
MDVELLEPARSMLEEIVKGRVVESRTCSCGQVHIPRRTAAEVRVFEDPGLVLAEGAACFNQDGTPFNSSPPARWLTAVFMRLGFQGLFAIVSAETNPDGAPYIMCNSMLLTEEEEHRIAALLPPEFRQEN